jgi:hypothetical protein
MVIERLAVSPLQTEVVPDKLADEDPELTLN